MSLTVNITVHRGEHPAGIATGPADLALPFAAVALAPGTRAPELATRTRPTRNRRRSGSATRRPTAA